MDTLGNMDIFHTQMTTLPFLHNLDIFFLVCLKTVKQVGDNKLGVVVYIPVVISGGDHMYTFFENMSIQVFCPFEWD